MIELAFCGVGHVGDLRRECRGELEYGGGGLRLQGELRGPLNGRVRPCGVRVTTVSPLPSFLSCQDRGRWLDLYWFFGS